MENIRRPAPDIFHTSDLLYDNHMEVALSRCNELPLPTLSYLSTATAPVPPSRGVLKQLKVGSGSSLHLKNATSMWLS